MTLEVKHAFHSLKGDGPDTTLVQPSNWNALHTSVMGAGLAGNPGPADGPLVEIPVGEGLGFKDGALINTVFKIPVGVVLPLAGNYEPPGWLICDGRAISRTDYAVLFSICQEKFGEGDGLNTFNIPDMRGRVPAGKDNLGGVAANRLTNVTFTGGAIDVGKVSGTETHALAQEEIAEHDHILSSNSHRHFVATDLITTNDGTPVLGATETVIHKNTGAGEGSYTLNGLNFETYPANRGNTNENTHTHTITHSAAEEEDWALGGPHLNLQPTITMNYIIFTDVYPT